MIKYSSAANYTIHTEMSSILIINWYKAFLCIIYSLSSGPELGNASTVTESYCRQTRPLEVQTAKVQVPCWAMLGQSSPFITPSLCLSLSLPPWWLMANAALVHLHIPLHPSLTNRCEILDMAWIWLPGERGDSIGSGRGTVSTFHSIHSLCFFDFWLCLALMCHWFLVFIFFWNSKYWYTLPSLQKNVDH